MSQTEPNQSNILIVDDTPANLKVLTSMLVEQGHQVRPAINGRVALTAVHEALPDLILLDITMPGLDGYEVCRQLKMDERTRDIPIIFISALDRTEDKVKAFTIGGVDYVTKPFHVEEVLTRVNTHLTLHRL
jgi:PleD family two-component response regulator